MISWVCSLEKSREINTQHSPVCQRLRKWNSLTPGESWSPQPFLNSIRGEYCKKHQILTLKQITSYLLRIDVNLILSTFLIYWIRVWFNFFKKFAYWPKSVQLQETFQKFSPFVPIKDRSIFASCKREKKISFFPWDQKQRYVIWASEKEKL